MNVFAKRMRELREEMGWSQEKAAEIMGMQRPTVAGYESIKKKRIPRDQTLIKIAEVYKTSTDYLLGNTDQRYRADDEKLTDNRPLSDNALKLLRTIELSDDEAITKIKESFTNNGKTLSDEAVKEILSFARYKAGQ